MNKFYSHKELMNKMEYFNLSFLTQIRIIVNLVSLISILLFILVELGSFIIFLEPTISIHPENWRAFSLFLFINIATLYKFGE